MSRLSDTLRDNKIAKAAKRAKFSRPEPVRSPIMALMLLPNEQIQGMILSASTSSYVPVPRGDHRPFAQLERIRKEQKRSASWTGARA